MSAIVVALNASRFTDSTCAGDRLRDPAAPPITERLRHVTSPDRGARHDWNDPTGVVRRMFAAFGAGDLDALVETVHPESHWTYIGANPRLARAEFTGKAKVRKFFQGIITRLDMAAFNTDEFIAQGDTVVVFGSEFGTVRATGQPFRNEWTQKYVVRDNQITGMVEYNIQVDSRS